MGSQSEKSKDPRCWLLPSKHTCGELKKRGNSWINIHRPPLSWKPWDFSELPTSVKPALSRKMQVGWRILNRFFQRQKLVGGWNLPLWKIMEWVRQLGVWHSQLFMESHEKFHGSSHHQPERVPSGKHTKNYGKSPFWIGKSTINSHVQ